MLETVQARVGKDLRKDKLVLLMQEVMKLQYRYAYEGQESKKSNLETTESVTDHLFTCSYLLEYIYPLLTQEGININFEKTFDILLAGNIPDLNYKHEVVPEITLGAKTWKNLDMVKIVGELPKAGGFNIAMWASYVEGVLGESKEAKLAKAISGLSTMLYIQSKEDAEIQRELVAGNSFTEEMYQEKIGKFANDFPVLKDLYEDLLKKFKDKKLFKISDEEVTPQKELFSPKDNSEIERSKMREQLAGLTKIVESDKKVKKPKVFKEIMSMMSFMRLKRKTRYGNPEKSETEHRDTVGEHTYMMLILARYFLPIINENRKVKSQKEISFHDLHSCIMAHDAVEGILGDVPVVTKTDEDSMSEEKAVEILLKKYIPDHLKERVKQMIEDYLSAKKTFKPEYGVLTKAIDCVEAYLYLFDVETREKLKNMTLLGRREYTEKIKNVISYFKEVESWWFEIMKKMEAEGMK